jgi:hypothetical protein
MTASRTTLQRLLLLVAVHACLAACTRGVIGLRPPDLGDDVDGEGEIVGEGEVPEAEGEPEPLPDGPVVDARATADCTGQRVDGREYFFCSTPLDNTGAVNACAALDATLVDFGEDAPEGSAAEQGIVRAAFTLPQSVWIGLDDQAAEGTFRWAGGNALDGEGAVAAGFFIAGEPNEATEDCIVDTINGWADVSRFEFHIVTCELGAGGATTGFPPDCNAVSGGGNTLMRCSQQRPFFDALGACAQGGGKLLSYGDQPNAAAAVAERAAMRTLLGNDPTWIGLDDLGTEGSFVWTTEQVPLLDDFKQFQTGEPNNLGGEDCVEMFSFGWNDAPCTDQRAYICER